MCLVKTYFHSFFTGFPQGIKPQIMGVTLRWSILTTSLLVVLCSAPAVLSSVRTQMRFHSDRHSMALHRLPFPYRSSTRFLAIFA